LRYVISRSKESEREEAYRIYVTKGIELFVHMNIPYTELIKPTEQKEERSSEEIISSIKQGLGALGSKK